MLLYTEHTPLPSRSLLSPRWMPPPRSSRARRRTPTAGLDVPATRTVALRTCADINMERLRPYLSRTDRPGGAAAPPPRWSAPTAGRSMRCTEELLKFNIGWGQPYILVRHLQVAQVILRNIEEYRKWLVILMNIDTY